MTQKLMNKIDDFELVFKEIKNLVVDSRSKIYSYVNVKFILEYWKNYIRNTGW